MLSFAAASRVPVVSFAHIFALERGCITSRNSWNLGSLATLPLEPLTSADASWPLGLFGGALIAPALVLSLQSYSGFFKEWRLQG
uniref:Uncharacterized protein n=1 Tax=Arundo donax TaxID=35708 RepID=A0A0A9CL02_ARUDO